MRSRRRGPLLAAAIVLLIFVVLAGVIVVVIAGPVIVVATLVTVALLVGLVSQLSPRSRRRRTGAAPHSFLQEHTSNPDDMPETTAPGPHWVMRWESVPLASAVPRARDQLTRVLADWGLTGEAGEPTQLVVTELISNAIDHARAPIELTVSFPGEWVRVEVRDAAAEPPRQQPPDPLRARGRGLQMVDALSSQWGWTNDGGGKTVWADVSIGWPGD